MDERLYVVDEQFPRLSVSSFIDGIPNGIERIDYDVNLEVCRENLLAASSYEYKRKFKS